MPDDNPNGWQSDSRFESVLAEIQQAQERGQTIDVQRYLDRFPDLAEPLRDYFDDLEWFGGVVTPRPSPAATQPEAPMPPPELPPGSQFGDYEIHKELGRGGMGVVYLARQRRANRLVALKLIRTDRLAHLTPQERQEWLIRFRTEGQAAARIADDHVVTVYVVGDLDGRPFYSMRYVEGRSLAENLKEGPLLNRRAAILMEQVARAVQAVHEQGVLHRDLKPHNILVDARGRPYVTDFGLAKLLDAVDSPTHTGDMLGSPHYMSPEQAQGTANVSEATDVYGLGATLYALLTGRPPFQGTTAAETLYQVRYHEPAPPRRVNPAVDRDLNTITLRCLEKEPRRRFRSAAALADELRLYLEGRPILTRPVGPAGRLGRWCRRNPAFAVLSAAAVVLLILASTLIWAYLVASREAGDAGQNAVNVTAKLDNELEQRRALAYLEDMPRAQKHINAGELIRARELLAKWRPQEGKKDLRGWEWFFLDAQCREVGFFVRGHQSQVQAVAWSPDGQRLASADRGGMVKVWNLAVGKDRPLFEMQAKPGGVAALAWSPDGKLLAGACREIVQLWNAGSGKEEQSLRTAGNSLSSALQATGTDYWSRQILIDTWIVSLTWSPDSRRLALFDANGKVQVWDLTTRKDGQLLGTHRGGVHSAAWSPNGDRLASIGGDGQVKVWAPPNPNPRDLTSPVSARNIVTKPRPSYALTWSDDGKQLNVISGDGEIRALDMISGAEVAPRRRLAVQDPLILSGMKAFPVYRYVWGPGGKLLASVAAASVPPVGGEVKFWDATTGKELFSLGPAWSVRKPAVLQGPESPTGCCPAWDPSARRLALGGEDGMVKTFIVGQDRRSMRTPFPNAFAFGLAWSSDGRNILCAADITAEDITDAQKRAKEAAEAWKKAHPGPGLPPPPPPEMAIPLRPGQRPPIVAGLKSQPQIQIRDAVTGEVVRRLPMGDRPNVSAESQDGKWLAAATGAGLVQLWPAVRGKQPVTLAEPPKGVAPAGRVLLAWSREGILAYSTPNQTAIRLWDSNTRKPVPALEGHGKPLRSLAWCPDSKRLASAGDDGTVKIWDVRSGKATSGFTYVVVQGLPRFGLGGKTFASSILSWSQDGKRLAVAGEDEVIRIWDVDTQPAKELFALPGHPANEARENHNVVCSVAWSPDGKRLAAASPDGTFLLWDTDTRQELLTLRPAAVVPFQSPLVPSHAGTLAWSVDGRKLGFFGASGAVTIWDKDTGR
jgi:WD40 repeat protein/predicted Ser/Thr protein kinase